MKVTYLHRCQRTSTNRNSAASKTRVFIFGQVTGLVWLGYEIVLDTGGIIDQLLKGVETPERSNCVVRRSFEQRYEALTMQTG